MTVKYDKSHREDAFPQPTTKRRVDKEGDDFYPTPTWATHALMQVEYFPGKIWEPACGDGAMSEIIKKYNPDVISSDLYDHKYEYGMSDVDFLYTTMDVDNIITNPPYHSAESFVRSAMKSASGKVALFLRLAFAEGVARANGLHKEFPAARVWAFAERVTCYPAGVERKGGSTTAYAWWIWDVGHKGDTILKIIPPGYRKRFDNK